MKHLLIDLTKMGLLCSHDSDYICERECYKCQDTFISFYGGYSKRRSCRFHNYGDDNICQDCDQKKGFGHNCYHIRKRPYFCI